MMFFFGILRLLMRIMLTVLLIILLIIIIFCISSVKVNLSFWDGKFDWNVRYFGLQILPRKKKEKKTGNSENQKKSDKKSEISQKEETAETEENPKKPVPELMDKILEKMQKTVKRLDLAGSGLTALPSALYWFGRAVTWYDIETDILIADEDAAVCARNYGLAQMVLQNLFGQTGSMIHVRRKSVSIRCDFIEDKSKYQFRCKVKINIGKTILAGIVFLWNYLKASGQAKKTIVSPKL